MEKLAIHGGPKLRKKPWPAPGRRFGKEELKHLKEALDQNTLFYMHGNKTKQMCAKMSKKCGAKYAIGCSSGSAALHGAVKACGVGPGDEVITSPITDAGTILGIIYEGAIPVFADVDPETSNITAKTIEARITSRTRAVIAVHLAGCPADIKPILRLCKRKKIRLIEDCAQSWGAKVGGRWVGTFGDFGCFSLNDFKHISAGDGGLIVTNNEKLYHHAWLSIDKCYDRVTGERALEFVAPNYRITELQSAVAVAQLDRVGSIVRQRNKLGKRLTRGLEKIEGIVPHKVIRGSYPTYWFYLIQVDPDILGIDNAAFAEALNAEGIPCHPGYTQPVYLSYRYLKTKKALNHSRWPFSAAKKLPPYKKGYCPQAELAFSRVVWFGLNQWLSEREIDDTITAVKKVTEYFRAKKKAKPGRRRVSKRRK